MELKKIEQFRDQINEIKILERRIEELEQDIGECVADTVKASSKHFPYIQHTVRVMGVDAVRIDKISRIKDRLNKRKIKLYNDMEEVESFIDTIDDSIMRQIITLRYIKGLSWNNVGYEIYKSPNGDTVRMSVNRFFKRK